MEEQSSSDIKEIKDNQILSKYIKELADDVKLTEYNIREKSLMASSMWAKWLNYLYLEKSNMQRIEQAKQNLAKKKLSESTAKDSILRMKSTDKLLQNDDTMQKLKMLSKQTQDNIDYIERALNILQQFGFNIKNVTEIFKLQFQH